MNSARHNILARLRATAPFGSPSIAGVDIPFSVPLSRAEKVAQLKQRMEAMHTEVIITHAQYWIDALKAILRKRNLNGLLYAPTTALGQALAAAWDDDLPPLQGYTQEVEQCKEHLFSIDASITLANGGLADVGALVLWPSADEPRLMSLVPALHIAVLNASDIHESLADIMSRKHWREKMPTNVLLISGPSKTADIELVLTFGVHGPKELIVLIVDD